MTSSTRPEIVNRVDLWHLHKDAAYLIARGGDRTPPPAYCNVVLTNKCNLRCEICGSQKYLDHTDTTRSHMPLEIFLGLAETVFPVVSEVELNSQGDPLLHPDIRTVLDKVAEHRCELRLQTNGTLFTDALIERLCAMHGTVYLSIDAVGPKFDEVRRNGVWTRAEPMMRRLFAQRDPARLGIHLYPTLTRRTVGGMVDIARWAAEHGIDSVEYHNYNPVNYSVEEVPTDDELTRNTDAVREWLSREAPAMRVSVNSDSLHTAPSRRRHYACPIKGRFINASPLYPLDADHPWAATRSLCMAPFRQLDVGISGNISVCCRSQDVPLGRITSAEAFADLWFGHNYEVIRESLTRGDTGPLPLPNCESCIRYHAPKAGQTVSSVRYRDGVPDSPRALRFDRDSVPLAVIFRNGPSGHCFRGQIPYGLDPADFELWEDGAPLPLRDAPLNDIRTLGGGRYAITDNIVYFSTSDGTLPIRNERRYELRRRAAAPAGETGPVTGIGRRGVPDRLCHRRHPERPA